MSDTIHLRGITARGRHGVLEWERQLGQPFVVDADLTVDVRPAAASDDLALTVDYSKVAQAIVHHVESEVYQLIETLADRIAAELLTHPLVTAVTVTVHKPEAPVGVPFSDVAVRVTREIS